MNSSGRCACLALVVSAAQAVMAADTVKLGPTRLELPSRIGPMRSDGVAHDFGGTLGVGYQYGGSGLSLTVYVYDAGLENIPDGGDTIPACQQFERAKSDILNAGYDSTTLEAQQLVRLAPPQDAPLAREAVLELARGEQSVVSYLWLTAFDGNFVKLRFSLDARLRHEIPEARRVVLDALGTAMKPHLVDPPPADAPGKKGDSGTSISLSLDGSEDEMAAGILYTMLLAAAVDQRPDEIPVCGGPVVPSFETEVGVYRGLLAMEAEGEKSRFAHQLGAADAAGFLEELVWGELHRDVWGGEEPEGLAMRDYKSWKKKYLKRFRRPAFGAVVIDHPRPLPLESTDQ